MVQVKGYIKRKTMLYKTNVEYGDYTMNHVLGCAHGCLYPCYAFLLKKRFGKNSILRGLNFEDGATAKERNNQIGGHKA